MAAPKWGILAFFILLITFSFASLCMARGVIQPSTTTTTTTYQEDDDKQEVVHPSTTLIDMKDGDHELVRQQSEGFLNGGVQWSWPFPWSASGNVGWGIGFHNNVPGVGSSLYCTASVPPECSQYGNCRDGFVLYSAKNFNPNNVDPSKHDANYGIHKMANDKSFRINADEKMMKEPIPPGFN